MLNFRLNFPFYNSFSLNSFNVCAFWSYKLPVWFLVWDSAEPGIMLLGLAEGDLHPFSWNLRHALVRNSITLPSIALSLLAISATNLEIHLSFFNIQAKCQFSPLKPRFEWFWTLFFALLMFFISTTMTNHPSKKRRNLDQILNFLIHNFLSLTLSRHNWITLDKSASKNPPECRHKAIRESGGDGGHQGGICIGEA